MSEAVSRFVSILDDFFGEYHKGIVYHTFRATM